MRTVQFIATLLLVCVPFLSTAQDNTYEDLFYDCIDSVYRAKNQDLDALLNEVESTIIAHGVLSNSSAQAKFDYYKAGVSDGFNHNLPNHPAIDTFLSLYIQPEIYRCRSDLNKSFPKMYDESKTKQLSDSLNSFVQKHGIKPKTVAQAIVLYYEPKWFDHPLFRYNMIYGFVFTAEREKAYIRQIEKSFDSIPPEQMESEEEQQQY